MSRSRNPKRKLDSRTDGASRYPAKNKERRRSVDALVAPAGMLSCPIDLRRSQSRAAAISQSSAASASEETPPKQPQVNDVIYSFGQAMRACAVPARVGQLRIQRGQFSPGRILELVRASPEVHPILLTAPGAASALSTFQAHARALLGAQFLRRLPLAPAASNPSTPAGVWWPRALSRDAAVAPSPGDVARWTKIRIRAGDGRMRARNSPRWPPTRRCSPRRITQVGIEIGEPSAVPPHQSGRHRR